MISRKILSTCFAVGALFAHGASGDDTVKPPVSVETSAAAVATNTNQPSNGPAGGAVAAAKVTLPIAIDKDGRAIGVYIEGSAGGTVGANGATQVLAAGTVGIKPEAGRGGVVASVSADCSNPALCSFGSLAGGRIPLKNGGLDIQARLPAAGGVFMDRTDSATPMSWVVAGGRVSLEQNITELLKVNAYIEGDATNGGSPLPSTGNSQRGYGFAGMQGVSLQYKVSKHVVLFGSLAVTEETYSTKTVSSEQIGTLSQACTNGGDDGHGGHHGGDDGHHGGDDGHHGGDDGHHGGTTGGTTTGGTTTGGTTTGGTTTGGTTTGGTQTINSVLDTSRFNFGIEGNAGVRIVF